MTDDYYQHNYQIKGNGGGFKPRQQQLTASPVCKVSFHFVRTDRW